MENFKNYFRFRQQDENYKNNLIYVRKNKENLEMLQSKKFLGTDILPPIYSTISSNLHEELTDAFARAQNNGSTFIGFDIKKKLILTSNLRNLYDKISQAIDDDISLSINGLEPISNSTNIPCVKFVNISKNDITICPPHINMFLTQLSKDDRTRFELYIASIMDVDNNTKQALHLYDSEGNSGKSMFLSALTEFLYPSNVHTFSGNLPESEFWLANIENKALVIFQESTNPLLLDNAKLKSLMGGDRQQASVKFQQEVRSFIPKCKMFIMSNFSLHTEDKSFASSRLIVCNFKKSNIIRLPEVLDADFKLNSNYPLKEKLTEEMSDFVSYCINKYIDFGKPQQIPEIGDCSTLNLHSDSDEVLSLIFSKYFEITSTETSKINIKILTHLKKEVKIEQGLIDAKTTWTTAKIVDKFQLTHKKTMGTIYLTNLKLKEGFIYDEKNNEIVLNKYTKNNEKLI